jgi:glycosyltransferase involved in cell wall biosynthesis
MGKSSRQKKAKKPPGAPAAPPGRNPDWSGRPEDLSPEDISARFGTIQGTLSVPYPPNTLTVAMIVKNEAANIRAAVESFRPIADEIVVYDTGSTDGTQAILDELGVKWKQGEWRDDFAWARNRSLEMAACAWILWMDGDDRIPPDQLENFRKLKTAPMDRAFGFQVINTQGGLPLGARFMQLRMIPNHPDIRFKYRIHEQLFYGVARLGLHCFYTDTTIHHTGYEDPALKAKKARRNLDILKTETERLAREPSLCMSVGDSHYILGEYELGIEAYKRTMEMPGCERINRDIYREMPCCIGMGYQHLGRHAEAIGWFEKAIALHPGRHEPHFYKANSLLALGRPAEAEAIYANLLGMPVVHSTTTSQYDLIQIYSAFNLARFRHARGEFAAAREVLLEMHKRYSQVVESWHLLGRCQAALGDAEGALASLTKAVALNPSALAETHADRLRLLKTLGREGEFREGLEVARKIFPAFRFPEWELSAGVLPAPATASDGGPSHAAAAAVPAAMPARAPTESFGAPPGPARPRLSLCMIVRDESANLPACLDSAAGLADEIVVVDTGSTDGTQDLARRRGARVVQDDWKSDFSLARNASLSAATGAWILWLDADDRLLEEDKRAIRRLAEADPDAAPRAYGFLVKNSGDGGRTGSVFNQIRLFPNRPALRFRYPVHEQILPALEEAGIPVEYTSIKVLHTGYADPDTARAKQVRNKAILESLVAAPGGSNPVALFTLANACADLGLHEEAIARFREAGDAARASGTNPHVAAAAPSKIAAALARLGRLEEARSALEAEVTGPSPSPEAILVLAQVEDALGRPDAARPWFERLLSLREDRTFIPVDFQMLKIQALQFLGKYWHARNSVHLAIALLKAGLAVKEGRDFTTADLSAAYRRSGVA